MRNRKHPYSNRVRSFLTRKTTSADLDKKRLFFLVILFCLIVIIHHNILVFQKNYHLNLGPGDKGYFTHNAVIPFGIQLTYTKWARGMGYRSFIDLPLVLYGDKVRVTFGISNRAHSEVILLISNGLKEKIASFTVSAVRDFMPYTTDLDLNRLPENKINIKITNAAGRFLRMKTLMDRIDIYSPKGARLPTKHTVQFAILILGFLGICLLGGIRPLYSLHAASVVAVVFTLIRYFDFPVYISYLWVLFYWGLPFLALSSLLIRLFIARSKHLFKGESRQFLFGVLLLSFLTRFFGFFYLYHFNKDALLRCAFQQELQNNGVIGFLQVMSAPHAAAAGAAGGSMPYPPWYNLFAAPFIKLGADTHLWLKFQVLAITSFYAVIIYAFARVLGLSKSASRLASLLSIFAIGFLRDLAFHAYDTIVAYQFAVLFMLFFIQKFKNLADCSWRQCALMGSLLGFVLILHPGVLITIGLYFVAFLLLLLIVKVPDKLCIIRKVLFVVAVGSVLSMLMFYGPYLLDMFENTLPHVFESSGLRGNHNGGGLFDGFLDYVAKRLLWTLSVLAIPFIIYGAVNYFRAKGDKTKRAMKLTLVAWLATYVIVLVFRTPVVMSNVFKHNAEYQFIYPLSLVFMSYAYYRAKEMKNRLPFVAIRGVLCLWVVFSFLWFYLVRVDTLDVAAEIPNWLKYVF